MEQTSLEAYRTLDRETRRQKVLDVFCKNPDCTFTDKELGYMLRWPINCVTPRRGELAKDRKIVKAGSRVCPITKKRCNAWRLNQ